MLTFLTGGARAGKSHLATQIAIDSGLACVFIATAQALDEDMTARIARHRADRPEGWSTIEEPLDVIGALERADRDAAVIVDCLTLWVTNLMFEDLADDDIFKRAEEAAAAAVQRTAPTIVVTNEVGSGVHPETELGMRFRDTLGRVNAIWAARSDEAFLVVAGKRLPLC